MHNRQSNKQGFFLLECVIINFRWRLIYMYLLRMIPAGMKGSNKGTQLLSVLGQLPDGTPGVV